jgi:hypothetical protein
MTTSAWVALVFAAAFALLARGTEIQSVRVATDYEGTQIVVEEPQALFPSRPWADDPLNSVGDPPRRQLTMWNASAKQNFCAPTDPSVDCAALVDLFFALDNQAYYTIWDGHDVTKIPTSHTLHGKWATNKSFCTWERVTCAGFGDPANFMPSRRRVYRIDLSRMNLNGTIPASIGNLTELRHLDLSWNSIKGSIPASIGRLTKLQHLHLHHNQLTGSIPSSVGELKLLNTLAVGHNKLTGMLPTTMGTMSHLERLSVRRNNLTGAIPSTLGNLVNLEYLVLWDNQLNGAIPSELCAAGTGQTQTLKQLRLQKNQLSGPIPAGLANCRNLNWIDVSDNLLTGNLPGSFVNLTKLKHLNAFHNQLQGVSTLVNKHTMNKHTGHALRDFIVDHDLQAHY